MEILCKGEQLLLLPERAVFWAAKKTLLLADLHLGKTAHFRKSGIAIPSTVMGEDLKMLSKLIQRFGVKNIIVAGDMFHHHFNIDILSFKEWRLAHDIDITLVPGNHDKLLKLDYDNLSITLAPAMHSLIPFMIAHDVAEIAPEQFYISGHVHPGYVMAGKAKQALRLPCFIHTAQQLILPAFSNFSGLNTKYKTDLPATIYVIAGKKIMNAV